MLNEVKSSSAGEEQNQNLPTEPAIEQTPPDSPNQKTPLHKDKNFWIALPIFIFILVIVLFPAIYIVHNILYWKNHPAPNYSYKISPSPTPVPEYFPAKLNYTIGSTANGNIFQEKNFGFSFEYSGLKQCCNIQGPSKGGGENGIAFAANNTPQIGADSPFDGLAVYVVPNKNNISLSNYVDNEIKAYANSATRKKNNIKIGSLEGFVLDKDPFGISTYYFAFPDNKNFLVFAELNRTNDSFMPQFNQILSTFKFTNPTSSANSIIWSVDPEGLKISPSLETELKDFFSNSDYKLPSYPANKIEVQFITTSPTSPNFLTARLHLYNSTADNFEVLLVKQPSGWVIKDGHSSDFCQYYKKAPNDLKQDNARSIFYTAKDLGCN